MSITIIKEEARRRVAGFKLRAEIDGVVHKFVTAPETRRARCTGCAFDEGPFAALCSTSRSPCGGVIWVPRPAKEKTPHESYRAAFYEDAREDFEG